MRDHDSIVGVDQAILTHAHGVPALPPGSTHPLTPTEFMRDLMVLELGGIGSKALPNGVAEHNEPARSPQEIYDQRFFTKDAPPRQQRPAPAASPQPGGRLGRPSAAPSNAGSSASVNSANYSSGGGSGETEKKKNRGFLRF